LLPNPGTPSSSPIFKCRKEGRGRKKATTEDHGSEFKKKKGLKAALLFIYSICEVQDYGL
jgi:hypothetical protein